MVAIALTLAVEKRAEFIRVIAGFKQIAQSKARSEWGVLEDKFDKDIEEAGNYLARLIFENPSENPDLSMEWPARWLDGLGVTEHNSMTLFKVSHSWETNFINRCLLFDKVKLKGKLTDRDIQFSESKGRDEGGLPFYLGKTDFVPIYKMWARFRLSRSCLLIEGSVCPTPTPFFLFPLKARDKPSPDF